MRKKVNLLKVVLSGVRRRWLVYFIPRYAVRSLLKRKGECLSCGRCCLLNKPWCAYFKDGKCQIYKRQPFFCKIFPIDDRDRETSGVTKECGYWWDGKE